MMVIDKMCNGLVHSIKNKFPEIDEEKSEVINYGLYIFFADVSKTLITITLATLLGVLKYIIIAMLVFGLIRTFCGGSHASTWLRCLIINNTILFSVVYSSILLSNINSKLHIVLTFIVAFVVFYKLVPSDHHNKPIVSVKQKRTLRIISFSILLTYYLLALFVLPMLYANIISFSVTAAILGMLPITYKLSGSNRSEALNQDVIE